MHKFSKKNLLSTAVLFMKLSTLIFFFISTATFTALAHKNLAQDILSKRITIQFKELPLPQVLEKISASSGVLFTYSGTLLKSDIKLSFNAKNLELKKLLDKLFSNQPFSYELIDKEILIRSDPQKLITGINLSKNFLSQTIRGIIIDQLTHAPLPGVTVTLLNSNPLNGTSTDNNGYFKLKDVPIGKQNLQITAIGYKDLLVPNIEVNSGKEVVLNINLEEKTYEGKEVIVTSKLDKSRPQNDLLFVSTRTFSVEETRKYAAAVNDPLRTAMSFPGVIQLSDGNEISIRGNSPNGLLWRMEGVEIPNPNHFSTLGTSGGGLSIVSAQLLSNCDFSTGAFSAEYGNALSGVFDLRLRKGNNEKREYTLQAGFLGMDLSTEGPFKKGYGGSYLVNYRYSTLRVLGKFGLNVGALNAFQDLSFNVFLPTKKLGSFTLFGFGGLSDRSTNGGNPNATYSDKFTSNTGAVGLTHSKVLSSNSYLKTILALSGTYNGVKETQMNRRPPSTSQVISNNDFNLKKITLSTVLNTKLNEKSSLRSGLILNRLNFNLLEKKINDTTKMLRDYYNSKANSFTFQAFSEWKYQISERLTSNIGVHYFQFLLNNSKSLEPRAALKYDLSQTQSISAAYGLHSQLQPFDIYFLESTNPDNSKSRNNESLGFSKAHHFVLAYDQALNDHIHLKLETYYQSLYNIPISTVKTNNFSMINHTNEFGEDIPKLENKGTGRNYGLELTLEHYTYNNFYMLFSGSLYDSKYTAASGKMFNTRYDGNYAFSYTAGKEIVLSGSDKKRIIGLNLKAYYAGGLRVTPIDQAASIKMGAPVSEFNNEYGEQMPDYYRLDIRASIKRNYARATGTLSLDIQNVTNHSNVSDVGYDPVNHKNAFIRQGSGILPVLSYRIEF